MKTLIIGATDSDWIKEKGMYIIVQKKYFEGYYENFKVLGTHSKLSLATQMVDDLFSKQDHEEGWMGVFEVEEVGFYPNNFDLADAVYLKKFDESEESDREVKKRKELDRQESRQREQEIAKKLEKIMKERSERLNKVS